MILKKVSPAGLGPCKAGWFNGTPGVCAQTRTFLLMVTHGFSLECFRLQSRVEVAMLGDFSWILI
jgi:hypothetical protein